MREDIANFTTDKH